MKRSQLRVGDILKVDIRGRVFYAKLIGVPEGTDPLQLEPITGGITWRTCSTSQVLEVYVRQDTMTGRRRARKRVR